MIKQQSLKLVQGLFVRRDKRDRGISDKDLYAGINSSRISGRFGIPHVRLDP